jgi:predicted hotdog family 3-hydroxylacyl-ACP dehydratase
MSGVENLPPADVLPHEPPMVLLTRIVRHEATRTICAVDITALSPFLRDDKVIPVWVGVEYMAQCVAAHAGLVARARGEPVKLGLLIGARRLDFHAATFDVGQTIFVTASHIWGERELASFDCSLTDGDAGRPLAEGLLSVYLPSDEAVLRGRS